MHNSESTEAVKVLSSDQSSSMSSQSSSSTLNPSRAGSMPSLLSIVPRFHGWTSGGALRCQLRRDGCSAHSTSLSVKIRGRFASTTLPPPRGKRSSSATSSWRGTPSGSTISPFLTAHSSRMNSTQARDTGSVKVSSHPHPHPEDLPLLLCGNSGSGSGIIRNRRSVTSLPAARHCWISATTRSSSPHAEACFNTRTRCSRFAMSSASGPRRRREEREGSESEEAEDGPGGLNLALRRRELVECCERCELRERGRGEGDGEESLGGSLFGHSICGVGRAGEETGEGSGDSGLRFAPRSTTRAGDLNGRFSTLAVSTCG